MADMKVRRATPDDMNDIAHMAVAFHASTCYAQTIPLDIGSAMSSVAHFASSPTAIMLVAENDEGKVIGMAAGSVSRHWFNASHVIGQEHFWWVNEDARGCGAGKALKQGLEDWALQVGCHTFCMATTANLTPESLAQYYKSQGYEPHDIYFSKVLKCPVQSSVQ